MWDLMGRIYTTECVYCPSPICFLATMRCKAFSATLSRCENTNWNDPSPLLNQLPQVVCSSDRRLTDSHPRLSCDFALRGVQLAAPVVHPGPLLGPPLPTGNIRVCSRPPNPPVSMHWSPVKAEEGLKRRLFGCQCEPDTVELSLPRGTKQSQLPWWAPCLQKAQFWPSQTVASTDSLWWKGQVTLSPPQTSFITETISFMRFPDNHITL